jgi:HlyD family secretion protein
MNLLYRVGDFFQAAAKRARLVWRVLSSEGAPSEVVPEAITFQTDIEQLIHSPPPRYMRSTTYLLFTVFFLLLMIATFVDVDAVIMASGRLTADAPPIVLQPIERGIIRELKVKEGDVVKKGQVLATLDPTFAQADMTSLTAQERQMLAQVRRLEAELNNVPYTISNTLNAEEQLQATLYQQRQSQYASRLRSFDEDIRKLQASIKTAEDDGESAAKQVAVAKEVETMRANLFQSQTGSKLNLLDAQSTRMRAERDYQEAQDRRVELEHTLESKVAERQSFVDEWRRQLLEELVKAKGDAAKLDEGLAKATLVNNMIMVTAPEDGVVLEVVKRSVGSVMREAEPLVTLVPSDAPLIAEIMISSGDVGYVRTGDDVIVKVDAFPYLRHGMMEGRLRSVSEESYDAGGKAPEQGRSTGGAFHRAEVELVKTKLEHMMEGAHIIPGMTVSAEVKVGRRSIMAYFLSPLRKTLNEGIRER